MRSVASGHIVSVRAVAHCSTFPSPCCCLCLRIWITEALPKQPVSRRCESRCPEYEMAVKSSVCWNRTRIGAGAGQGMYLPNGALRPPAGPGAARGGWNGGSAKGCKTRQEAGLYQQMSFQIYAALSVLAMLCIALWFLRNVYSIINCHSISITS